MLRLLGRVDVPHPVLLGVEQRGLVAVVRHYLEPALHGRGAVQRNCDIANRLDDVALDRLGERPVTSPACGNAAGGGSDDQVRLQNFCGDTLGTSVAKAFPNIS